MQYPYEFIQCFLPALSGCLLLIVLIADGVVALDIGDVAAAWL